MARLVRRRHAHEPGRSASQNVEVRQARSRFFLALRFWSLSIGTAVRNGGINQPVTDTTRRACSPSQCATRAALLACPTPKEGRHAYPIEGNDESDRSLLEQRRPETSGRWFEVARACAGTTGVRARHA